MLVDEFQDTDPIQGEILERLTGESFPSGRLFLVGDAKQSIYRFRGARPEIFEEFRDRFPESGRLSLTENFRSVPGILDFVNALFADTFEDPDAALIPVVGPVPDHDQPVVEFLWATESEEAAKSSQSSAHDRRELEARWLARRLRQRLGVGWMVRDRQTREVRQAHPGDVAFLFRAMTDVGPYESALVEEGFDYHVIGGSAFYAQQEVHDLINVLSVIEDPLDAVALAGTLRSPFFCLSDDGLFWLSTARHDLVDGLRNADAIAQLSERDRQHARRARDLLSHWRGLKDRVAIAALVDRVLDESGYEAALLGEFLGDRKRANARKLVRLARQFDQQGGFTLAAFVARLRADLKRPPREEQAATTDEQGTSVRLMSIHQAKGLEFPIVVIPDLNRKSAADLDAVAFDPTLGPLVRRGKDRAAEPGTSAKGDDAADEGTRESLGWLAYQALERHHEEKEALRLFYVATTRARDALDPIGGPGAVGEAEVARDVPARGAVRPSDRPMPRSAARGLAAAHHPCHMRSSGPGPITVSLVWPHPDAGGTAPPLRGRRGDRPVSRGGRRRRAGRPASASVRRLRSGVGARPDLGPSRSPDPRHPGRIPGLESQGP